MSSIQADKTRVREICITRLAEIDRICKEDYTDAVERERKVWWRDWLGLSLLSYEKAEKRLKFRYDNEMFSGPIGRINDQREFFSRLPYDLLAAIEQADTDFVTLSVEEAATINSWTMFKGEFSE